MNNQRLEQGFLVCTALLAFFVVVARASIQAITIDEADSYLIWAARPSPSHWEPASNNHVLNSLLVRLFTSVLGPSHLTIRIPSLIGAALYISAAFALSRLITDRILLRWSLFVCLVYNPFVLDYLVAARGYSMALGFLMSALAATAHWHLADHAAGVSVIRGCIISSLCLALSFASNFSFGFVNSAALLGIMLLAWRKLRDPHCSLKNGATPVSLSRFLAACILPGLIVTLFLSASVVLAFPKNELWYGATSLLETLRSVIRSSLYEVNPHIANPIVYKAASFLKPRLFPALGMVVLLQILLIARGRVWLRGGRSQRLIELGAVLAGIPVVSLLVHWLAFKLFDLLLPMERTALYLVAFWFLTVGIAAAVPLPWRAGRLVSGSSTVVLLLLGTYFLLCLRLTYFKEWKWNADAKDLYSTIAFYNHRYDVRDVITSWRFTSVLNFYRTLSGKETFGEFTSTDQYPPGKKVYVLLYPFDAEFVAKNGLKVVYHGETSDAVVAVSPELELATQCKAASSPAF